MRVECCCFAKEILIHFYIVCLWRNWEDRCLQLVGICWILLRFVHCMNHKHVTHL